MTRQKTTIRVITAIAATVLGLVMLVAASYAWLTISRAPEITGADVNIGANGSLEIALLNTHTYADPDAIPGGVGVSSAGIDTTVSNGTWGNVIDLSDEKYGMSGIRLAPTQLNLTEQTDGTMTVGRSQLLVAQIGADGRIAALAGNCSTAVYDGTDFSFGTEELEYGVRAIGTTDKLSVAEFLYANATSAVRAETAAAKNTASTVLTLCGQSYADILVRHYWDGENSFSARDVETLSRMISGTQEVLNTIDSALRQGIVAFYAQICEDEIRLNQAWAAIENRALPLSQTIGQYELPLPPEYRGWVDQNEQDQRSLAEAAAICASLTEDTVTWEQIRPAITALTNEERTILGDWTLAHFDRKNALSNDIYLTLAPGSGVFADIADYSGDVTLIKPFDGKRLLTVTTQTVEERPHLLTMYAALWAIRSESPEDVTVAEKYKITDIYGFMMDFAFRCNAPTANLQLQTEEKQRVDGDANSADLLGNGSFMEFTGKSLEAEKLVSLMEAMRIGFLDVHENLLAIAKPNTSNYFEMEYGTYRAPIYLYDYALSDDGSITILERRDSDPTITGLVENIVQNISVIVWMDGNYVSNELFSVDGDDVSLKMNLQFSTDTVLVSAGLAPYDTDSGASD